MTKTCLSQDEIASYVLGTVEEDKLEAIDSHLAGCSQCQAVADQLEKSSSDELMEILRGPEPAEGFSSEPECRQALPKIKRIGETVSSSSGPSKKSVAEDELFLPQKLGEYLLLERIGGNMGAVYKALHTTMDRLVAMKVLPARALANQQAIARFQREMKAVGRLEHPNIVRAYDAREIDGKHVLVMEFVEGRDLSDVVGSSGSLTPADACEVVRQAAVGLQYVHEKGLVHRDVKPSNLMLTAEGQVKILDLGLARFRAREPDEAEMTGSGDVVGTANYMAPEQVTGSHKVDARADVYGLGCTLYKLLSGHAPFDDPKHQDTYDILTAHLSEPVPSIQEIRPDVPDELAAILNRMLAKSPSDRFETPGQIATALEPFTSGCDLRTLAAGRGGQRQSDLRSTPPLGSRPIPRLWKVVAAAAAAVLILLVVGGKTGVERLGHFWGDGGGVTVARHDEPPKHEPQPNNQPVAAADDKKATSQVPTAAGDRDKPKNEPPAARDIPAKPKQDGPAVPTGPTQPKQGGSADSDSPVKPKRQTPQSEGPGPEHKQPQVAGGNTPAGVPASSRPQVTTGPGGRLSDERPAADPGWLTTVRNDRAKFVVDVGVDHRDRIYCGPPAGPDGKGEVMSVTVKSSKAGYLYLIHESADKTLSCLFPNKVQPDNRIPADTEIVIPHPDAKFRLRVGPPYGKELLKAVVTLTPREPKDFGVPSFTEGDVTPLQPVALKNVFVEIGKDPDNWAERQVKIETKAPTSPERQEGPTPGKNQGNPVSLPSGEDRGGGQPVPSPGAGEPGEAAPTPSERVGDGQSAPSPSGRRTRVRASSPARLPA